VPGLLDDLVGYVNDDTHSPLAQAAIAHAQFETIHPFADGNGRTGRALVHVVLRRRGLAPAFVPPISLVLATWASTYVEGLMTYRHLAEPDGPERSTTAAEWLRLFAAATHRACIDAEHYATRIDDLTASWRDRLGRVRADSGTDRLLSVLPGAPIITVESASALIDRSKARTTDAVNALADAGILRQRNVGRQRYRVFEATDVLELFTDLERALASPTGDTRDAPPVRPTPR
jgi:Fic family protein